MPGIKEWNSPCTDKTSCVFLTNIWKARIRFPAESNQRFQLGVVLIWPKETLHPIKNKNKNKIKIWTDIVHVVFCIFSDFRDHPFILTGGRGVGVGGSKNNLFTSKRSRNVYSQKVVATLFFFYKNRLFPGNAFRIFQSQRQNFFPITFADKKMFPQKNYSPTPTPSFKLNVTAIHAIELDIDHFFQTNNLNNKNRPSHIVLQIRSVIC